MAYIPRARWLRLHTVYLETEQWQRLRRAVLDRSGGLCERCGRRAREVHHLTYRHWHRERLDELQALCWPCHRRAHGLRPMKLAQAIERRRA